MYPVGVSHLPIERTVGWKRRVCVVMLAAGWLAPTVTSVVSAQEAVDSKKAVAEANRDDTAAKAKSTDAAKAGASGIERRQSTDSVEFTATERDAVATIKPESLQLPQVCRKITVTGTRFPRQECRTAEQWAEVDARQSAQGRRFVRDIQGQSSVIGSPAPGQDTPEGRASGLPNPAGL